MIPSYQIDRQLQDDFGPGAEAVQDRIEAAANAARALAQQKAAVIRQVINELIGEDWTIADAKRRGGVRVLADGRERFQFDGVDRLEFAPMTTRVEGGRLHYDQAVTRQGAGW